VKKESKKNSGWLLFYWSGRIIIHSPILPMKGIALLGFIILVNSKQSQKDMGEILKHEYIHTSQQRELLIVFAYLLYAIEFFVRSIKYLSFKKAYYNISLEREAYHNMKDQTYFLVRDPYMWLLYMQRPVDKSRQKIWKRWKKQKQQPSK